MLLLLLGRGWQDGSNGEVVIKGVVLLVGLLETE
jgi:hypothetical protein